MRNCTPICAGTAPHSAPGYKVNVYFYAFLYNYYKTTLTILGTTKSHSDSSSQTTDKGTMYFYVTKHEFYAFFIDYVSYYIRTRAKPCGFNRVIFNIYIFICTF
jgi:hypothetical protein